MIKFSQSEIVKSTNKDFKNRFSGFKERFTEVTSNFDALIQQFKFKNWFEDYEKNERSIGQNININLLEKEKVLSFMLNHQNTMISSLNYHETRKDIQQKHGYCSAHTAYGYDFKNPKLLIGEFKEFLKNVNLNKQYVEINDLKYNFPLNINDLMYGQNRILELEIQVYIFNKRQKSINSDKNEINDTNKDFEFLLDHLRN